MKKINNNLTKAIVLIISIVWQNDRVSAQDIHFSQFNVSPILINPAAAGTSEYNYRLVSNYKNQWAGVSTPYSTTAIAYDMSLFHKAERNNYLGVGISAFTDAAGKSRYGTSQVDLNISGVQQIDHNNAISLGIMSGYAQRKIKLGALSWDSQYNGEVYDPNLATGETQTGASKSYLDMGAGLMWQQKKNERISATAGVSMLHLNKPVNSFNTEVKGRLSRKLMANAEFDFKLSSHGGAMDSYLHPKVLFSHQGAHNELILGLFMKYLVQAPSRYTTYHNPAIFEIGGFYRAKDAFVIASGLDYNRIKIGVSYDINVSKLRTASSFRGGFEVSLTLKGIFKDSRIKLN